MRIIRSNLIFGLGAVSALLLDQVTKAWAQNSPSMVLNSGISFGLFASQPVSLLLPCVFLAVVLYVFKKAYSHDPLLLGVCSGACLSNILDRILYGGVRDFLPIPLTGISNNIADWFIVLTLLFLVIRTQDTIQV